MPLIKIAVSENDQTGDLKSSRRDGEIGRRTGLPVSLATGQLGTGDLENGMRGSNADLEAI
jgi:hypothetical protein